jgi:hypothetical protein
VWITGLLRVCKHIYDDMVWVIKSWRPVWRLERPIDIGDMHLVKSFVINDTKCWPKLEQLDTKGKYLEV